MEIKIIKGNIFTSGVQTLVNPVNTVGVMGAGLALEFKIRYPEMFNKYLDICKNKQFRTGQLWLYKADNRWILNFPTKEHWKDDSKVEYIMEGLEKFINTYKIHNITSIAFPVLGTNKGNLSEEVILPIMQDYLTKCDIDIEIYRYDPNAPDDLYHLIKNRILAADMDEVYAKTTINKSYLTTLMKAFSDEKIKSINRLLTVQGIGEKTIIKLINSYVN
jgi:O-acetyl-ADP-ribose deacetylase (regulator of RNase III)